MSYQTKFKRDVDHLFLLLRYTQGDEEETRIALQRKQTHETDTWREMCTIPASLGQQEDSLLAQEAAHTAKHGGVGMGLKLIEQLKHDLKHHDDEHEGGKEDTDLPLGTRCGLSPTPQRGGGEGHGCSPP